MNVDPKPVPADLPIELLGHESWVRRLARGLLDDPAAAEDVVQETWLAALRRPPERGRPLRPWLAAIVRNLAHEWRRGEGGRRRREQRAARVEGLPSTDEMLERVETQRALAEAVRTLAEPYRTTILLRYVEELSSAEIARRQGVPAGTVRSRLKRGLAEMRDRLDGRYGDRRGTFLALGALVARTPGPLAKATSGEEAGLGWGAGLSGAFAMSTVLKISVAAVVLAALSLTFFVATRTEASSAAAVAAEEVEAVAVLAEPEEVSSGAEWTPREDLRVELASAREQETSTPTAAEAGLARVEGRIVDTNGLAVPGAVLEASARSLVAAAGVHGRAALELDPRNASETIEFVARAPGFATEFFAARLLEGETTYLGDVVLSPGGAILGYVRDAEGRPLVGADVRVTAPATLGQPETARRQGPRDDEVPSGTTDAHGAFRIDGVHAGSVRVWAGLSGMRWAYTSVDVPVSGEVAGIELQLDALEELDVIAGIVLDPDGDAVPGCGVLFYWRSASSGGGDHVTADEDGRFRIKLKARAPHDLTASDDQKRWMRVAEKAVPPGRTDVVLQFGRSREVTLRVTTRGADPVEEYSVHFTSAETGHYLAHLRRAPCPEGERTIALPAQAFHMKVEARMHEQLELGPFEPEAVPEVIDVELERLPGIRGRVTANGRPVSGAEVSLFSAIRGSTLIVHNGFHSRFDTNGDGSAVTDADGEYELTLREDGESYLLVAAEGFAVAELGPLELEFRYGASDVDFALNRGGAIEGRVLVPPGGEAAGTIVGISRGDGRGRTLRVGLEGTFRFEGLTPGPWQVLRCDREVAPGDLTISYSSARGGAEIDWACEVFEGRTTHFDLDLSGETECTLDGRLFFDGAPAVGWSASLERGADISQVFESTSTAIAPDGSFRLRASVAGRYGLVLENELSQGVQRLGADVELTTGEVSWSVDLPTGRIIGSGAPTAGESELGLSYRWQGEELTYRAGFHGDDLGRFVLPQVPVGAGTLRRYRPGAAPSSSRWETISTVDVKAGSAETVEIR